MFTIFEKITSIKIYFNKQSTFKIIFLISLLNNNLKS
jgi:hypothetical protein